MRETATAEIKAVPAQPQRWWVDYMHMVQSGRLVDTQTGKAVLSNGAGFHIIDIDQLKSNYVEACQEALGRLGKVQADINGRFVNLMAEMAKYAKVET